MKKKILTTFFTIVAACGLMVGLASCGDGTSSSTSNSVQTTSTDTGTSDTGNDDSSEEDSSVPDSSGGEDSSLISSEDTSEEESSTPDSSEDSSTPDSSEEDSSSTEPEHVHDLQHADAVAATCTEDGNIEYWYCNECGKYYSDAAATTEITLADTVIPATGHDWNTTDIAWNWSGYTAASATFTCNNDSDHTQVVDATITNEVTTAATCTDAGVLTYTATVTFEGVEYTNSVFDSIDAIGHDWDTENIVWNWTGYESATATFTCLNDSTHTETLDATITSEVTAEATCTTAGTTLYIATVTLNEHTYTNTQIDTTPATGHTYGDDNICDTCGAEKASDGLAYTYDSTTESYSVALGNAVDTEIYIPSTYNDGENGEHPVTALAENAFYNCTTLTSVSIPSSVTTIGKQAFRGCTALTSINIPDSVTTMGQYVFYGDTALATVSIGNGLTEIPGYTFRSCSITSIDIPSTITSIGTFAFAYCKFTSLTLPDSITSIGTYAFRYCENLASLSFGNAATSISNYAFADCTLLTNVTMPSTAALSIGNYVFSNDTALTSITIGGAVTNIGPNTFTGCTALSSIAFESVTKWYVSSKADGSNLISMDVSDTIANVTYFTDTYKGYYWFWFDPTAPESFTYEYDSTTEGYTITGIGTVSDKEIVIPSTYDNGTNGEHPVTKIGSKAFQNNTTITSLTLSDNVTTLDTYAFDGCTALASVSLGKGLTSLGDYAFRKCSSITSLTLPDTITYLGTYSLAYLSFETINLPESITSTGTFALAYNTALTSITIPNSLTSLGAATFRGCTALTSVTLHDNITSIGNNCFYDDSALASITLPANLLTIGTGVFRNCAALTSINIPKDVVSIGSNSFNGCTSLTSATFEATDGWFTASTSSATSGNPVDVTDPLENVTYLTSTYVSKYWIRSVTTEE